MNARKKVIHQHNAPKVLQLQSDAIPGEPELEEFLIAKAFENPDVFPALIDRLKPEDFFLTRALYIWRAMELVDSRGEPIELVAVKEELEKHALTEKQSALDAVGGLDGLMTVASKRFDIPLSVEAIAHVILSMAKRRRLIDFGHEITGIALQRDKSVDELAIHIEKRVADVLETVTRQDERTLPEAVTEYFNYLEGIIGTGQVGLPTGFKSLDCLSYGMFPGEVSILAGHAGMGKTAVANSIICNLCETGARVALFPLEMSEHEIVRWLIARVAKVNVAKLKNGTIDGKEWQRVVSAIGAIGTWKLEIQDDLPGMTPLQFKRRMNRLNRQGKIDAAFIDGLWLMNSDEPEDGNGPKDTNQIMRSLAEIVKPKTGLGIPLWITHQFNQDTKKRKDKRPQLTDLQYGGAKDAHNVYGLFRWDYFRKREGYRFEPTELHVLKSRSGNYGTAYLQFMSPGYVDVSEGGYELLDD